MRASALAVFLAAGPAAAGQEPAEPAPETRVEQWTRLRREKAAAVKPPETGFLERQLLAIEKAERPSLFDLNVEGFYPRAVFLASGSEIALGTRFWRPDLGDSAFDVHGSVFFSFDGYEFYDLQFGRLPHRARGFPRPLHQRRRRVRAGRPAAGGPRPVSLYGSLRYRHYPQNSFYGLGDGTAPEDATQLPAAGRGLRAGGGLPGPARTRGHRAGRASCRRSSARVPTRTSPPIGALYDDTTAPGLDRQPDFLHLGGHAPLRPPRPRWATRTAGA